MLSQPLYYHRTARTVLRTQLAMSLGLSTRVIEAITLSPSLLRNRYRSSYETPSSSSLASSLTLPIRKRYRDRPLGLGYGAARRRALELAEEIAPNIEIDPRSCAPVQTPASPESSSSSLPASPNAAKQRKLQEMRDRVTTLEQERSRREQ
ncbi:hypothetical protein Tco_1538116 [Tanacetum coccineum]